MEMDDWIPSLTGMESATGHFTVDVIADDQTTWGPRSLALKKNPNEVVTAVFERLAHITVCTEILSSAVGLVPAPIVLSRTFGSCSLSTSDTEEEAFETKNRRRIHLIDRRLERGLSEPEASELAELRASLVAVVNDEHPLPFAELEELDTLARQLAQDSD